MYRTVIVSIVIITFAFTPSALGQYESAEKCYSCNSRISCKEPVIQLCDQSSADKTLDQLKLMFRNIPNNFHKEYQCLNTSYIDKNITLMSVAGCIYKDLNPCTLNPLNTSWISRNGFCKTCSTNLCTLNLKIRETTTPPTTMVTDKITPKPGNSSSTSILISSYCLIGITLVVKIFVK